MSKDREQPQKQHTKAANGSTPSQAAEHAKYVEAEYLVDAASYILHKKRPTTLGQQPAVDIAALWMLSAAATGEKDGKSISGSEQRALFNAAMNTLEPAMRLYAQDDAQREWLAENVQAQLDELDRSIAFSEADDRVRGAVLLPGNKVIDPSDDNHPREQAAALHEATTKLIETLRMVNEAVLGMHEKSLEEEVERILHNEEAHGLKVGSLVELGNALSVVDGYLILTDDELMQRAREIHEFVPGVRTLSELVKGVTLLVGGTLGVVTQTVGLIAKAAGEPEIAQVCAGFAQGTGLKIAKVVAWVELVNSVFTVADWRHSSRQQKMDAVVGGIGAATTVASEWVPEVVGAPVAAVTLGYNELKLALNLYWGGAEGIVSGLMAPAFEVLREEGRQIAGFSEVVLKAQALVDAEREPSAKEALGRSLKLHAGQLGYAIDSLLSEIGPADLEAGMARHPGVYKILVDAFAPVWAFRHVTSPEGAMLGASVALSCLAWVQTHQAQIVEAAAAHRGIADVKEPRATGENTDGHE